MTVLIHQLQSMTVMFQQLQSMTSISVVTA